MTGVTFLALANGAPDVFVSLSAGGLGDEEGISLALGALFGAGLFVCTFVYGYCVILCDNRLIVAPNETGRDIIFFIIANLMIIWFGYLGEITLIWTMIYIIFYIVFIFYVLYIES